MKTFSNNNNFLIAVALLLAALAPKFSLAQRFSHPGGGGGNRGGGAPFRPMAIPPPRPASPAPRQASPAPVRQQESRPAPAPATENRTINGGGNNLGNHDFHRNVSPSVHGNANTPRPAVVNNSHPRGDVHENVYHTGGYRGIHPYYYHPYRPSYWGPNWHPFGFFLSSLAANALLFTLANQQYYYEDGCYYEPSPNGGYTVVPPPIGAIVPNLPQGYETTMVGNDTFYYYGGAFYVDNGQGYQVVAAPPGAVITQLPVGAVEQAVNGDMYMVYNNVYYQPISQDGQDAYEVVQMNN
jgi:hypothetical protein